MHSKRIRSMCIAGVFTALVFVVTAYLHIPTSNGYIHVGDGLIYLSACILPWPYAVAVGAGGAFFADCLTGFAIWAPGSVVIKAVTALLFTSKGKKMMSLRNWLALVPAAVVCAGGYYLYESLLYGNFIAPLASIPASLTQSVTSSGLFVAIGLTIDRMNYKAKLIGGASL
ncbi:MAG: TIGR04002 family protein [Ruminococcaceae bacterium]|nr:TIGR04002 family protein [Oscillospiraceae bacterium]